MRLDHITPSEFGVATATLLPISIDKHIAYVPVMPGGNSELEPPDPIPNSEVKRLSADDSVGVPM